MAFTPRINIYDTDQTTISGGTEDVLDIAFVPGFANIEVLEQLPIPSETSPDVVYVKEDGVVNKYKKNGILELDTPAEYGEVVTVSKVYNEGESYEAVLDDERLAEISDQWNGEQIYNTDISNITHYKLMYSIDANNRNIVKFYCFYVTSTNGSDAAAYDVLQECSVWTMSDEANYATDENAVAVSQDENGLTLNALTAPATFKQSGAYEFVEQSAIGLPTRFDSYAEFTKAIGSTPMAIWQYKQNDTATYDYRDVWNYVRQLLIDETGEIPTPVQINQKIATDFKANDAISIVWVDRGWLYAAELLRAGLPIFYQAIDGWCGKEAFEGDTEPDLYTVNRDKLFGVEGQPFVDMYAEIADKGEYNVKYITTGAFGLDIGSDVAEVNVTGDAFQYPFYLQDTTATRTHLEYLVDIANYRKDAMVLADGLESYNTRTLNPNSTSSEKAVWSLFDEMVKNGDFANFYDGESYTQDDVAKSGRRAECTFPWADEVCNTFPPSWSAYRTDRNVFTMPGSFIYLKCLANSLQKYPSSSWEAIAGVTRAVVPDFVKLDVTERLSNAVADAYNQRNDTGINAITNIRPYGYCIWGNRTLVNNKYFADQGDGTDGLIASSFVDIMSMVCNVNKVAYRACKRLMFEKNNDILWARFLQGVSPYLDQLKTAGAIRTYEIKKIDTEKRGHLIAKIVLYPVYSLDSVDCEILLRDTEAEV